MTALPGRNRPGVTCAARQPGPGVAAGPGPMTRVALPEAMAPWLTRAAPAGMMAEWPKTAARTGPDITHGQLAASHGRCSWPPARNWAPARAAWQSTWAAGTAPRPSNCWLAAGQCWR